MNFLTSLMDCPIGNGGGTCKTIKDVEKLLQTEIPAIEIGSITELERLGNTGNIFHPGNGYTLNSLGLPNPGREYYEVFLSQMIDMIHAAGRKAIVNVVGFTKEEYSSLTRFAFDKRADMVVENYGCPNIWVDNEQKGILSYDLDALKKTTIFILSNNITEAREGRIGIKLSPIDPLQIVNISKFLNNFVEIPLQDNIGYVSFVTTQNTVPNCYDEEDNVRIITPGGGLSGMAGRAIFPMALGQVKQFRMALNKDIKIIGVGGVTSGKRVKKMLNNGANFVQVASLYYATEDPSVFTNIGAEFLSLE